MAPPQLHLADDSYKNTSNILNYVKIPQEHHFYAIPLSYLGKFSYLCIANHHKNERKIQNCLF